MLTINLKDNVNKKAQEINEEISKIDNKLYKEEVKKEVAKGYGLERVLDNIEFYNGAISALNEIKDKLVNDKLTKSDINNLKVRAKALQATKGEESRKRYQQGKWFGFDSIYTKLYSKAEYNIIYA